MTRSVRCSLLNFITGSTKQFRKMESQIPYDRMNTGQAQAVQSPCPPTVIVASTSSQSRYKNYSSRLNVTLGIIQIVCGVLLKGFSVSKFLNHSKLNNELHLTFVPPESKQSQQTHVFISDCTHITGFTIRLRCRWNMEWSYCKLTKMYSKIIGT